jgi:L-amino acid N-acyltransferase YncA
MIRVTTQDDAAAMLEIYSPFILNSGITQETEVPSVEEFQKRISSTLEQRPWLVCEISGEIAGYAYAAKHRDRRGYQWCVESSVYIGEKFTRYGVGFSLYTALFEILKIQGYVNCYAVITLPNERSTSFHEKFGFRYFTTFKDIGYKLGQWHDVGWWQYDINPHTKDPVDPIKFPGIDKKTIDETLNKATLLLKK